MTDQPTDPQVPDLTTPDTYSAVPEAASAAPAEAARPRWVPWAAGAGLVGLGVLVGGGAAIAISGHDNRDGGGISRDASWQPGQQGQPGQGFPGDDDHGSLQPPGGVEGEEHLSGTLAAVSSDSITLTVSGKQTTYALTSSSQIVVDGQLATASDLAKGDTVEVHVIPDDNGDMVVERIFSGDLGQGGFPQPGSTSSSDSTGTNA